MVVAPKGPPYIFSPWEALDKARRRDVYTGLVPKSLLTLRGILGGDKNQAIPGNPAVKVACGARSVCARRRYSPLVHKHWEGVSREGLMSLEDCTKALPLPPNFKTMAKALFKPLT